MNRSEKRLIRTTTRGVLVFAILGISVVLLRVLVRTAPPIEASSTAQSSPRLAVLSVRKMDVRRQWQGYGTAAATDSANVPARVTATVAEIPSDIFAGAAVKKGQLVAALDASDFRRQVEIAQQTGADLDAQLAMLDVQQRTLTAQLELESQDVTLTHDERERIEQLLGRGAANPRDLDLAKRAVIAAQISQLDTARTLEELAPRRLQLQAQRAAEQSSLQLAQQNLTRCRITSPINGVLQSVDVEVGENLNSGDRVARVVNLERIEVALMLPASAGTHLSVGDPVDLRASGREGLRWPGRIERIAPESDASTRTITAYVDLDQKDLTESPNRPPRVARTPLLTPGTFIAGVVTSGQSQRRWILPKRSVQDDRILLVADGVVQLRPVSVDFMLEGKFASFNLPDDQWVVLDDQEHVLRPGELVIVNGSTSVKPGQKVNPVTAAAAPRDQGSTP